VSVYISRSFCPCGHFRVAKYIVKIDNFINKIASFANENSEVHDDYRDVLGEKVKTYLFLSI